MTRKTQIVIVGGGAGGLELATRLGDTLGKRGRAQVTLVERARTHFWKPHLHEIAAGTVDLHAHAVDYLAQSHWHHFRYRMGEMTGVDRTRREVHVAPYIDPDEGEQVTGDFGKTVAHTKFAGVSRSVPQRRQVLRGDSGIRDEDAVGEQFE